MANRSVQVAGWAGSVALLLALALPEVGVAADWFGPAQSTPIDGSPRHLTQGHFNADGALDWAVVCDEQTLYVGLNDGTGTFELRGPFETPTFPWRVQSAKLNSDDVDDIALVCDSGSELRLYFNPGSGQFGSASQVLQTGSTSLSLAVGDLDDDGLDDVVVGGTVGVEVFWGDGEGVDPVPTTSTVTLNFDQWCQEDLTEIWDLQVRDVTDDGWDDIVLCASHDGEQLCETVFRRGLGYVENLGGRQLAAEAEWILHEPQAVSRAFKDLDTYDLDGNGQMDVSVVPDQSPHRYFFHVGGAWQQCPQWTPGAGRGATTIHDWNGDGWGDAVSAQKGTFAVGRGEGLSGFLLEQTEFTGLAAPTTGQFDSAPGYDLVGFGTGVVNLYSSLISPVAVESSGPGAQRGAAPRLLVAPSVVRAGVERVQLRLIGGASAIGTGERVSVGLYDHGGRLVGGIRKLVARDGHVDLRLGGEARFPSGIYRVLLESTSGRAGASIVVLR